MLNEIYATFVYIIPMVNIKFMYHLHMSHQRGTHKNPLKIVSLQLNFSPGALSIAMGNDGMMTAEKSLTSIQNV